MQLITQFDSWAEADRAALELERRGVATYVSNRNSSNVTFWNSAVGLWAIVDEQLADAERMLSDPDHEPSLYLSPDDIDEIKASVTKPNMDFVLTFLLKALGIVALIFVGTMLLDRLWPAS